MRMVNHSIKREANIESSIDPRHFAKILDRARHGDADAITRLYQQAMPPVYRYVYARLEQAEQVEDVVGEIFLRMIEVLPKLQATHEAGFFAWIFQIAHDKVVEAYRRNARQQTRWLPWPTDETDIEALNGDHLGEDPASFQEWREVLEELGIALGSLTYEQQYVIVGRFLAGQSIEDIAKALNKQPGAVRAMQFRALGSLAERMGFARQPRQRGGK